MSDDKKDKPEDFLDFSDIDGGVKTVKKKKKKSSRSKSSSKKIKKKDLDDNLPVVHPDDPIERRKLRKFSTYTLNEKDEIFLPIPTVNDSYISKSISDVSGDEFVFWLKGLSLVKESWDPDPEVFDGDKNLSKRIRFAEEAINKHCDMFVYSLAMTGIRLDKIIH